MVLMFIEVIFFKSDILNCVYIIFENSDRTDLNKYCESTCQYFLPSDSLER